MSYKGEDKWECGLPEINICVRTFKELKQELLDKLQKGYIDQATGQYDTIDYFISDIKIKRIKK